MNWPLIEVHSTAQLFLQYAYLWLILIGGPSFLGYLIYVGFYKKHFIKKLKEFGLDDSQNPFN